jgi:uncharacterized coiled-coil DUF342 family protein
VTAPAGLPPVWTIIIALVVVCVGSAGISSLLTVRSLNRRTLSEARKAGEDADLADANSRKVVAEASALLLEPLAKRAKDLEKQLEAMEPLARRARDLERQLATAQAELQQLRGQVSEMSKELTELQEENARLRGE